MNRKKIAIATGVAVVLVIVAMAFYSDLGTGHAFGPSGTPDEARLDCWWDIFCLGFCSC